MHEFRDKVILIELSNGFTNPHRTKHPQRLANAQPQQLAVCLPSHGQTLTTQKIHIVGEHGGRRRGGGVACAPPNIPRAPSSNPCWRVQTEVGVLPPLLPVSLFCRPPEKNLESTPGPFNPPQQPAC